MKSLDQKLAAIKADPNSKAFVIADAKDADMAFGVRALGARRSLSANEERTARLSPETGPCGEFPCRNLPEFLDVIRKIVWQGAVDIMLMSASVNELLTIKERLFERTAVTPAARANDSTDIWAIRHGRYAKEPSQPFRSASIDSVRCGQSACVPNPRGIPGADLGLYSLTFVNRPAEDRQSLEAFRAFREAAERKQFRYFLEIFDPNVPAGVPVDKLGEFINDNVVRSLAGVTEAGRPLFLKIAYHGPRAMEELTQYDPRLVVGILGGSAGTSYDAFRLLHDAQKHGARAALFGRKINRAEHPLAFIEMLRLVADKRIRPIEAVHAYHEVLRKKKVRALRSLEEDLQLTDPVLLRDQRTPARKSSANAFSKTGNPDFSQMSSTQRLDYHRQRLNRIFEQPQESSSATKTKGNDN